MIMRNTKISNEVSKHFSKRLIISLICLLFAVLVVFTAVDGFYEFTKNAKDYEASSIDMIDQRMKSLLFEINNFPRTIANDVLYLSKLACLEEVINNEKDESSIFSELVEKNFLEFIKQNIAYNQLRYIDERGNETIRA